MSAAPDLAEAIEVINRRHGTAWQVVTMLRGGYSAGAHMLRAPDGHKAVLKLLLFGITRSC